MLERMRGMRRLLFCEVVVVGVGIFGGRELCCAVL